MQLEKESGRKMLKCPYCGHSQLLSEEKGAEQENKTPAEIHQNEKEPDELRKNRRLLLIPSIAILIVICLILIGNQSNPRQVDILSNQKRSSITATITPATTPTPTPKMSERRVRTPFSARQLIGKQYSEVEEIMAEAGFCNIQIKSAGDLKDSIFRNRSADIGKVSAVSINGDDAFERYIYYSNHSKVIIIYHDYP